MKQQILTGVFVLGILCQPAGTAHATASADPAVSPEGAVPAETAPEQTPAPVPPPSSEQTQPPETEPEPEPEPEPEESAFDVLPDSLIRPLAMVPETMQAGYELLPQGLRRRLESVPGLVRSGISEIPGLVGAGVAEIPGLMYAGYRGARTATLWSLDAALVVGGAVVGLTELTYDAAEASVSYAYRAMTDWQPDSVFQDCEDCPQMVVIPAGRFRMGDLNSQGREDELPVHDVVIPYRFALGRLEITRAEWMAIMEPDPALRRPWHERLPMETVGWHGVQVYLRRLNSKLGLTGQPDAYRLPTEAEWEYAARAGTESVWWCGDDKECLDQIARYKGTTRLLAVLVGKREPNPFGLHDMIGNVAEWVQDCYQPDAYQHHKDYPAAVGNPEDTTCVRVVRGGAWNDTLAMVRTAARMVRSSNEEDPRIGFRVARTMPSEETQSSTGEQP